METPITNLFNIGDACLEPGFSGSSGATEIGYSVAELVRKRVSLE